MVVGGSGVFGVSRGWVGLGLGHAGCMGCRRGWIGRLEERLGVRARARLDGKTERKIGGEIWRSSKVEDVRGTRREGEVRGRVWRWE